MDWLDLHNEINVSYAKKRGKPIEIRPFKGEVHIVAEDEEIKTPDRVAWMVRKC